MFLDLDGTVYDFFNGIDDLQNNRVLFVGDPVERIREDFLRILRYFRFFARYGLESEHDLNTLAAIKNNASGLSGISGERLWTEMKRILPLQNSKFVMPVMMNDCNVRKYIGFDDTVRNLREFYTAHNRVFAEFPRQVQPITLFASLIESSDELVKVATRLRFSNQEKDIAMYIIENRVDENVKVELIKKQLSMAPKSEHHLLRSCIMEYFLYMGRYEDIDAIANFAIPQFPLRGDVVGKRLVNKRNINPVMLDLMSIWAASDYTMTAQELEKFVDEAIKARGFKQIIN